MWPWERSHEIGFTLPRAARACQQPFRTGSRASGKLLVVAALSIRRDTARRVTGALTGGRRYHGRVSVLERERAASHLPGTPPRHAIRARRRRMWITLAVLGALAILAGALVIPPTVGWVAALGRGAAESVQSPEAKALSAELDRADALIAVQSPLVTADMTAALTTARDAASAALPARASASSSPEALTGATSALGTAVTAYASAAAAQGTELLGQWSDAQKSTEDALAQSLPAITAAKPDGVVAALAAATTAANAMIADAQAYRDSIIAAASGHSSQPTGGDVAAQLAYLHQYALSYNSAQWADYNPYGGDCVNFASQGLLARGWTMDDTWNAPGLAAGASKAWISTTAMEAYLTASGFVANDLDHLDRVRVGDIGIFDWGETGPGVDHTMTVSKVEYTSDGPVISFVSHNEDGDYRELQYTLFTQHQNSTVRIYSIP